VPQRGDWPSVLSGMWQQAYIEARPPVYLQKALITSHVKDGTVSVRAHVVNTTGKTAPLSLKAKIAPWTSARYRPPVTAPATDVKAGEFRAEPGESAVDFAVKLRDPVTWSPESPNLYLFQLFNDDELIGQERFGFREIVAGEHAFYLNGKKIFFRGNQFLFVLNLRTPSSKKFLRHHNYKNCIEQSYERYLSFNYNMFRDDGEWPKCYYDIADEKGVLIQHLMPNPSYTVQAVDPMLFDGKNVTPFFAQKIKRKVYAYHNNASIILYALSGELFDTYVYCDTIEWDWVPYLKGLMREWKKHSLALLTDPSCGGRPPSKKAQAKVRCNFHPSNEYIPADYHSIHNYMAGFYPTIQYEDDNCPGGYRIPYLSFQEDHPGRKIVVLNSEMGYTGYILWHRKANEQIEREVVRDGRVDRNLLVEKFRDRIPGRFTPIGRAGILNYAGDESVRRYHANAYRWVIEQHRRERKWVAGFTTNNDGDFLADPDNPFVPKPDPIIFPILRSACQPIYPCLDGTRNRNPLAGAVWQDTLYIMNDRENPIVNMTAGVSLEVNGKEHVLLTVKRKVLGAGEVEEIPFKVKIPALPTGHYRAVLTLAHEYKGERRESTSDYPMYVLGNDERATNIDTKRRIGLFHGKSRNTREHKNVEQGYAAFASVLKRLQIPCAEIRDLQTLNKLDVVIFPAFSVTRSLRQKIRHKEFGKQLDAWTRQGGRVVYAMQPYARERSGMSSLMWRYYTEMIVLEHPLFAGLAPEDLQYWSSLTSPIDKSVCDYAMLPIDKGLLATSFVGTTRLGMSIAEYAMGKGRILHSQLRAPERFGVDSVATRYMQNLLKYTLGNWSEAYAAKFEPVKKADEEEKVYEVDPAQVVFVDIRKHATMGFNDDVQGDKKGGWTDEGPRNNLHDFPVGRQTFLGVPFDIIDPATNDGKSAIVLRGEDGAGTEFLPEEARQIEVPCDVKRLFFLVSCQGQKPEGTAVGEITIIYDWAGTSPTASIPLVRGKNVTHFCAPWGKNGVPDLPEAEVAWRGSNASSATGVYLIKWDKTVRDDQKVQYIHFKSRKVRGAVMLLGITGEK